jgi:hypothetical protein
MKFVAHPIQIRADVICNTVHEKVCPGRLFRTADSPLLYHQEASATVIESTYVTVIQGNQLLQPGIFWTS